MLIVIDGLCLVLCDGQLLCKFVILLYGYGFNGDDLIGLV